MKKMILMSLIALTGVMAHAAGRQEASAICTSMSFDNNRNQCITDLAKYDYFDQGAINVCKSMSFDSGKNDCVKAIGNKAYDGYEIDNCAKNSFDSGKVDCLKNSGRPGFNNPPPPPPGYGCSKAEIILQLQSIDRSVFDRRNNDARNQIFDLIGRLQQCPQ